MARFAFLTWDGAGNQPPAVGMAQALIERGHRVVFAGYGSQQAYFAARDLRLVLLRGAAGRWQQLSLPEMFGVKVRATWAAAEHLRDVPSLLSEERPDAVVVDCMMFGALAALESADVPTMVLVHSAPGALFPPGGAFEARLLDAVNGVRDAAGRPPLESLWDAWRPFPTICTTVRELDPLGASVPPSFDYVGPIAEREFQSAWHSPWDADDRRPLVLVSFSTGPYWDQRSRIERTLLALANRPYRVLVTPGKADVSGLATIANASFSVGLSHSLVLPFAAITVTHAGHGTVAASLLHGVPLVCLPNQAGDQPALGAQVQALGAGRSLDGETATPFAIAHAVELVLSRPSHVASARALASLIAKAPGVAAAVDRLESLGR